MAEVRRGGESTHLQAMVIVVEVSVIVCWLLDIFSIA